MRPGDTRLLGKSGVEVTILGLGGAPLGNMYRAFPDQQARATIDGAYGAGIRYFDTAPLYGFGLSERNVPDYTLATVADDLELVADTLGLERFALFGPSGGAMIGTAYASAYPDRVSHLVFLGGFIRGPRAMGDPDASAHADAMDAAIRAGWGRSDSLFRQIFTTMLVPQGTPEQHRLLDQAQLDAGSAQNAARFHNLLANTDLSARAATIRASTLIFHGTREAVPFSAGVYAASQIPNARLVPLPTGNHILLEDEPAWHMLLDELERFIPPRR